jgi:List-Bact-rpt repeat protein
MVTSSDGGINCPTDCTEVYDPDEVVTLDANADPPVQFDGWSVSGGASTCTGTGACVVTMTSDASVTAMFS